MLAGLMKGGVEGLIGSVGSIIDQFHTSDEEKARMKLALAEHEMKVFQVAQEAAIEQIRTNREEAKHKSLFVSGWRPAVGWVCAAGLAYATIGRHLLNWIMNVVLVLNPDTDVVLPELPNPDIGALMTVLMGMLGMAGYRTYEKLKGVSRS